MAMVGDRDTKVYFASSALRSANGDRSAF